MRTAVRLLPGFIAISWLLWYSIQARWNEVIAPNIQWVLLGFMVATGIVWWLTRARISKALVTVERAKSIMPTEKLVAREIVTWKTVTRERSIYAEPK